MAAVALDEETALELQGMKGPLASSILLHAAVIIIAIIGLPYITPELPDIVEPITVELIDISEITQTNKPPPPEPARRPQPEQKSEAPPRPVQPQQTAPTPPKPVPPKPPEPKKAEAPPPKPEPAPAEAKPEQTKTVAPKPEKRPEPPAKQEEAQQEQFKSLLRNLMPEDQAAESEKAGEGKQSSSVLTRFSQQMTMSELDALRQQLSQCWSLMAGARYAEHLIVDIKLFVNPDRTIRDARIENQLRYSTDSYFRAAADSALRAVYRCSPLDLPPNKYDLWKVITVTFDPRTML